MPTFLELCQQFHEETGVAGSIASVTGQSGMLKRMVNWVARADRTVQTLKANWNFLWSEYQITLTGDGSYPAPVNLGQFDQNSFWLNPGTIDAKRLVFIDYKEWRDIYRHSLIDPSQPGYIAIKPNGSVAILPAADSDYFGDVVTADYWQRPTPLIDNPQVSKIPVQYHDIIVELAKAYHAAYRHDNGAKADAIDNFKLILTELKAHSLPGNSEDNKSESSIDMDIIVE